MADVVFIIGAGCSAHAGAPVMANFLERARELLAANEVKDRRKEFEQAFTIVSHLQRVHSKAQLDHNNIESVFSAVDLARTLRKLPGIDESEIDSSLEALIWLIVRTLEQSMRFDSVRGGYAGTSQYRALASLIRKLSESRPRLTSAVLTFNYDVGADMSFAAEGLGFSYCLDGDRHALTPLLKLHGSLNWFRSNEEGRPIVVYHLSNYIREYRRQHWMPSDPDTPLISPITKHAMEQFNKNGMKVDEVPILVPPTWSKAEYHRVIAPVWRQAAIELQEASYIFVIGYSLPETDQFFRLLFALGTEGMTILNKLHVFDPRPTGVKARFQQMLGHAALARFKSHRCDFQQALQVIEPMFYSTGRKRPQE